MALNAPEIRERIIRILEVLPEHVTMSTNQLALALVAGSDAFDEKEYQRLTYEAIASVKDSLRAYWHQGVPKKRFGKTITPAIWHRARAIVKPKCPHCGGEL